VETFESPGSVDQYRVRPQKLHTITGLYSKTITVTQYKLH